MSDSTISASVIPAAAPHNTRRSGRAWIVECSATTVRAQNKRAEKQSEKASDELAGSSIHSREANDDASDHSPELWSAVPVASALAHSVILIGAGGGGAGGAGCPFRT